MPNGGGLFFDTLNAATWGLAYKNSDGSFTGTLYNRFYYGFMILLIPAILIGLFFLFAHKTTPTKEPFETKKVEKRPMFNGVSHQQ